MLEHVLPTHPLQIEAGAAYQAMIMMIIKMVIMMIIMMMIIIMMLECQSMFCPPTPFK